MKARGISSQSLQRFIVSMKQSKSLCSASRSDDSFDVRTITFRNSRYIEHNIIAKYNRIAQKSIRKDKKKTS